MEQLAGQTTQHIESWVVLARYDHDLTEEIKSLVDVVHEREQTGSELAS